jgi:flagellar hook protein FlgE
MTHILGLTFEKKGMNVWDMTATVSDDAVTVLDGRIDGIRFNEDGSFAQISGVGEGDAGITLDIAGLGQQEIAVDFGTASAFDGLTQFGGSFSATPTSQDGYEAGTLSSISVRQDGVIQGTFTNGLVSDIATLQVATFPNPEGLLSLGDGFMARTPNSGLPSPGQGGSSGAGTIRSGALEGSNVDVAYEFTRLIIAQRGFQVNARTIGTTDEVLEELAHLVR